MKKKSLLLLPFLLLASCSNYDEASIIKQSVSDISSISETTSLKTYKGSVEGHVLQFNKFIFSSDTSEDLPSMDFSDEDYGESYALALPLRLTPSTYYPSEGTNDSGYSYATISYTLNGTGDNIHHMQYKKDNDNYVFYIESVSKELIMWNVYTDEKNPSNRNTKVYARYNIYVTYDKDGFLKDELIQTLGATLDNNSSDSIYYHVTYTYSA